MCARASVYIYILIYIILKNWRKRKKKWSQREKKFRERRRMGGVPLIHQLIKIRGGKIGPPHLITYTVPYFGNKFLHIIHVQAHLLSLSFTIQSHTSSLTQSQTFNSILYALMYILFLVLETSTKNFLRPTL